MYKEKSVNGRKNQRKGRCESKRGLDVRKCPRDSCRWDVISTSG